MSLLRSSVVELGEDDQCTYLSVEERRQHHQGHSDEHDGPELDSEHVLPDSFIHGVRLDGRVNKEANNNHLHPDDTADNNDRPVEVSEVIEEQEMGKEHAKQVDHQSDSPHAHILAIRLHIVAISVEGHRHHHSSSVVVAHNPEEECLHPVLDLEIPHPLVVVAHLERHAVFFILAVGSLALPFAETDGLLKEIVETVPGHIDRVDSEERIRDDIR